MINAGFVAARSPVLRSGTGDDFQGKVGRWGSLERPCSLDECPKILRVKFVTNSRTDSLNATIRAEIVTAAEMGNIQENMTWRGGLESTLLQDDEFMPKSDVKKLNGSCA